VQLHIGESIAPLKYSEKWIPGSRYARPGMTGFGRLRSTRDGQTIAFRI
jgi:hypothetical protein